EGEGPGMRVKQTEGMAYAAEYGEPLTYPPLRRLRGAGWRRSSAAAALAKEPMAAHAAASAAGAGGIAHLAGRNSLAGEPASGSARQLAAVCVRSPQGARRGGETAAISDHARPPSESGSGQRGYARLRPGHCQRHARDAPSCHSSVSRVAAAGVFRIL